MNFRKLSTELSHLDIRNLSQALFHARRLGLELNTLVTFAPFNDAQHVPAPADIAAAFRRLLKYLAVWVPRHAGVNFTCLWVAHADENGRRPHLHVFMHARSSANRCELQTAVGQVYPAGVIDVRVGSDKRRRHPSGYYGSTFNYITRHMSQQAYRMLKGRVRRAARPDENGRHRGIKAPFVGRRFNTTRNIGARAREAYEDERRRNIAKAQISAERQRLAA